MRSFKTLAAIAAITSIGFVLEGQSPPGPTTDRVGFPANYQTAFTRMMTMDRTDFNRVTVVYANDQAASVNWWDPLPYGSVLVQEQWSSKRDDAGQVILDSAGRVVPDVLQLILVKRKEAGFGEAYQSVRNGEWEYVSYRPDGTVATTPQASGGACAACHLQAGASRDWTFRRQQFRSPGGGAVPNATMSSYLFFPGNFTVKKGAMVTIRNDDDVNHTFFVPATGQYSGDLTYNSTYQLKFDQEGEYDVQCTIHPGMRAHISVKP